MLNNFVIFIIFIVLFYAVYNFSENHLGWITSPDHHIFLQLAYPMGILVVAIIFTVIAVKYFESKMKK